MKKKLLMVITMFVLVSVIMSFTGCFEYTPTVDEQQQDQQEKKLKESSRELGMPNIVNFQEKKLMKQIMELCDNSKLVCYVYTYSEYTGLYNYVGRSIGYGLPFGTEYTNPERQVDSGYHDSAIISQADPNGLFKPQDVQATWICMINDKTGERYIMYSEPNITISGDKLPRTIVNEKTLPKNY